MQAVIDIETDGLENPTRIHVAVLLYVETKEEVVFSFPDGGPYTELVEALSRCDTLIGHNLLGFDLPVLIRLAGVRRDHQTCIDTLVLSLLTDFSRERGHSLEAYGEELGIRKEGLGITDWSAFSPVMVDRCRVDVRITAALLEKFSPFLSSSRWQAAIRTEHDIAWFCQTLHENGMAFDRQRAMELKGRILAECQALEAEFKHLFPPRSVLIREVTPRATKFGTLSRSDFRWVKDGDLTPYTPGATFSLIRFEEFNPASPKQRIDRLWEAGWKPTEKTQGHKDFLRSIAGKSELTAEEMEKKAHYQRYGWTTSEENLDTLPVDAPASIHKLIRWLLLSSRVKRIDEWLENVGIDGRIHGMFRGIGAWTHRMTHAKPNMGNIPKFDAGRPEKTPYSDVMRSLWVAGPGRLLVGVDADSIQLRVLAHYIDDEEFTYSLVHGDKKKGTDPHSVNMRALGPPCKSRQDAKTFIYAWLLGAGVRKIADILKCSLAEAREANENFLARYKKLAELKQERIPRDAVRGFFEGLDGRTVKIPGDNPSAREHLALAGYLQNGEAVIMKRAVQIWWPKVQAEGLPVWPVNYVHDEWQVEVVDDVSIAERVAHILADSIAVAGRELGLRCPMAGSIVNEHGRLTIGKTWLETH